MKEKKYSIIQGYRSRQKYLVGILGILFITAALFSCDMQDLGTNANQNLENNYRSTSTSDQSDFNNTVQPYTFTHNLSDSVPVVTMPPVEVQTLLSEDRAEPQQNRSPVPPRFGKALEVSIDSENKGRWDELTNGDRLWRLRIASGGAYSINLIFDRFELPPGGKLFIYNEDQSTVLGPFNEEHNKSSGRFSTLPISGAQITLEYYEPGGQWDNTELRIANVIHAYRNIFGRDNENSTLDLGDSGSCNINVNCPSALGWQDESRSVAMVLVDQNTRLCSGALVNNVLEDRTPYFLSAFHCADRLTPNGSLSSAEIADAEDWLFWFNYKSETCSDPNSEPGHNAVSGASFRAANSDSDFLLLELSNIPPKHSGYDPYFAGWDATGNTPSSSASIHHPSGDIMKISFDDDPAVSGTWDFSPSDSHWETVFDQGTAEHGSSGAPLFSNHKIVGQIHGTDDPAFEGDNYCEVRHIWSGKFSMSWNNSSNASERLRDWLDPNNTGTLTLDGTGDNLLQVHIDGPYQIQTNQYYQFEAITDGGYQPYSWQWQLDYGNGSGPWQNVGGDSYSYTHISYNQQDFYLRVQVTDAQNDTKTSTIHPVTVSPGGAASQDTSLNEEVK